jgi:hypothetical protein
VAGVPGEPDGLLYHEQRAEIHVLHCDPRAGRRVGTGVDLLNNVAVPVLVAVDAAADPNTARTDTHVERLRLDPLGDAIGLGVDPDHVSRVVEPLEREYPHRTVAERELVASGSILASDTDLSSRSVNTSHTPPSPAASGSA